MAGAEARPGRPPTGRAARGTQEFRGAISKDCGWELLPESNSACLVFMTIGSRACHPLRRLSYPSEVIQMENRVGALSTVLAKNLSSGIRQASPDSNIAPHCVVWDPPPKKLLSLFKSNVLGCKVKVIILGRLGSSVG